MRQMFKDIDAHSSSFPLYFSAAETGFLFLVVPVSFIGGFVATGVFPAAVEAVGDERVSGMAIAVNQNRPERGHAPGTAGDGLGD